ncbi:MAG: hypothetical protein EHM23_27335 [Acidobacteria bacterium]|nr:MAG: hypothetical protein EHM23_27335 [Acidobacteriota bacterium]
MNEEISRADLSRFQRWALIVAGLAIVLSAIGGFLNPEQFFHSYLYAFLFWLGITLGSVAVLMLHHLVGGLWGFVIQRVLETAARLLPLMALLFIPIILGLPSLYEWTHGEAGEIAALRHKSAYLNVPFFLVRAVVYFAIWTLLAYLLARWSRQVDETGNTALVTKMERLSGPGLVIYGVTMTFAAVDWVMSLEPEWYSTIFGMAFLVGQGLSALCFAVIVTWSLADRKPLADVVTRKQFHDLGNLLLAFVMLWAYIAFSQFLIIWSGNIPEEAVWYQHRLHGGWEWVALILITLHFGVPFLVLLQSRAKKRAGILSKIAIGLLVLRLVDLYWIVAPSLHTEGLSLHWLDVVTPAAIGGVWLAAFAWQLKSTALLPVRDPRLVEALSYREEVAL